MGSGVLEAVAIAAAEDFVDDHGFGAIGRDVDQLDDPVGIGAGGGGEEVGLDVAGDGDVVVEYGGLELGEVLAAFDEALIFNEPGAPLGAGAVGGLDGAVAVGDRVGGVGNILGDGEGGGNGFAGSLRGAEREALLTREIERGGVEAAFVSGCRGPNGVALPDVDAGAEAGYALEVEARLGLKILLEEGCFEVRAVLVAGALGRRRLRCRKCR